MNKSLLFIPALVITILTACQTKKKEPVTASFLSTADAIRLNQAVYKPGIPAAIDSFAPGFEAVCIPRVINSNYAIIARKKNTEQYALVIRGSLVEFSNAGFQNFFLQDFNIFSIRAWPYTDTVKDAYISNGTWVGFQNLLQLRDAGSGLSLKEFIEQKLPGNASLLITGHSLGGNLAYPMAGYLKKELKGPVRNQMQLVTFGATAAGNAAFVQDLEEKFPAGERYVTNKDIAAVFPDIGRVKEMAAILGLEKFLDFGQFSIAGMKMDMGKGKLLDLAKELLETTNVINRTNTYVQSGKHERILTAPPASAADTLLTADAVFNRAYQFHKIDMYAELLGVKRE